MIKILKSYFDIFPQKLVSPGRNFVFSSYAYKKTPISSLYLKPLSS